MVITKEMRKNSPPQITNNERTLLVKNVRLWGGATSAAILDPTCKIFETPGIEGLIGYRDEMGCAIVFGDPLCPPENLLNLTQAFHLHCREQNRNIVYVSATKAFVQQVMGNLCYALVEFGEELTVDPHSDPRERHGNDASLVRRKVRHALHEGTTVTEYLLPNLEIEHAIEEVGHSWLKSRHGPQIYTTHVRLFEDRFGKRWFYAKQHDHIIGVLLLNQLQGLQGWLLNHVMFTPEAPHGTPEFLVVAALEALRREGCHYVTFGSVPREHLGEISGMGKFSQWMTHRAFDTMKKIFHLDGRKKFWAKFHPQSHPLYLLFSHPGVDIREVVGLIRALNVSL